MQIPKHDVFIFSIKKRNVFVSSVTQPIMVKLYTLFQQRLKMLGFRNMIVDTMFYIPNLELEAHELDELLNNPFYISEHYLKRNILLDYQKSGDSVWLPPYKMQPNVGAYQYCHGGKTPMFHALFVGGVATGKSALIHEFKNMLRELVPAIEIIECDNDIDDQSPRDITDEKEFYEQHLKDISSNCINIGGAPNYLVVEGIAHHNTKV